MPTVTVLPHGFTVTVRRSENLFSAIDESTRTYPLPVARLDCASHEDDVLVLVENDRRDRDLRILVEDESALNTHEPIGL